ncbi:MAG: 50S ribosomal protein L11 methyltransferase [Muribaculaceae bacterium]
MNDYQELRINVNPCSDIVTDVLAAMLADVGCESFVPDEQGLTAYIKCELYDAEAVQQVIDTFPIKSLKFDLSATFIEGRDWNSEWEKNYFQPIIIDDKCVIHSSFHTDFPKCEYDIVIDPKMAFGTGHHATTSQIIKQLLSKELNGLRVMDMGTGTGILAVLAAMRGAVVDAVEIDEMAYLNAVENVKINHHPEINVMLGDATRLPEEPVYDILLANINRNIIMGDIDKYAAAVMSGGKIILSGFYHEDIQMLEEEAAKYGLRRIGDTQINNWACLILQKE